jgi:ankyrin repeat protein
MSNAKVPAGKLSVVCVVIVTAIMLVSCAGDNTENLAQVAKRGDLKAVNSLLESGVDVDTEDSKQHATALMWAAHEGYPDVVELLIEHGAGINKRKSTGETALWFAAQQGRLEVVKVLVQHGADVNITGWEGASALEVARKKGHPKIVDYLRQAGAVG